MNDAPRWISTLLYCFGVAYVLNGVAMLFAPDAWFHRLIPGVPHTGPFNAHLVMDSGTFYVPLGLGLVAAARSPVRHVTCVVVAAAASALHAALHVHAQIVGTLPHADVPGETLLIYVPTAALVFLTLRLSRTTSADRTAGFSTVQRARHA
jgi:hypothetical protein